MAGLWNVEDYIRIILCIARLGPLHLGCNREVAALLRWLLCSGFTVLNIHVSPITKYEPLHGCMV